MIKYESSRWSKSLYQFGNFDKEKLTSEENDLLKWMTANKGLTYEEIIKFYRKPVVVKDLLSNLELKGYVGMGGYRNCSVLGKERATYKIL